MKNRIAQDTKIKRKLKLVLLRLKPLIDTVSRYHMFLTVVRGTNQGATLYIVETQLVTDLSVRGKLIRMNETLYR